MPTFKTFDSYTAHILANPDHPAHAVVRATHLKEMRERDPRLRKTGPSAPLGVVIASQRAEREQPE